MYMFSYGKGISSVQLAKELGITQRSSWFLLQRIRVAAGNQTVKILSGIVDGCTDSGNGGDAVDVQNVDAENVTNFAKSVVVYDSPKQHNRIPPPSFVMSSNNSIIQRLTYFYRRIKMKDVKEHFRKKNEMVEKIVAVLAGEKFDVVSAQEILAAAQDAILVSPVVAVTYKGVEEGFIPS